MSWSYVYLIAILILGFIGYTEYKDYKRLDKKKRKVRGWVYVGVIIATFGIFFGIRSLGGNHLIQPQDTYIEYYSPSGVPSLGQIYNEK